MSKKYLKKIDLFVILRILKKIDDDSTRKLTNHATSCNMNYVDFIRNINTLSDIFGFIIINGNKRILKITDKGKEFLINADKNIV